MSKRLLALAVLVLSLGAAVAASPSLGVPPCWPDCEPIDDPDPLPPPLPYKPDPIGAWDYKPAWNTNGTPSELDDKWVITGWALDMDAGSKPIFVRIDVYADGAGTKFMYSQWVLANLYRFDPIADITPYFGYYHGFRAEVPIKPVTAASRRVCMTALTHGPGADTLLRSGQYDYSCHTWGWLE